MKQAQLDSTPVSQAKLTPFKTPFLEIVHKLHGFPAESAAVDAEYVAVLYQAPWSSEAARDQHLTPLISRVASCTCQDRTEWAERFVVNLVNEVGKMVINLAGFPQEALACEVTTTVPGAYRATEQALEALQPLVELVQQAEVALGACVEALDEFETLFQRVKGLANRALQRPPVGPCPEVLEPFARFSAWSERCLAGSEGLRVSVDNADQHHRELTSSPDLACYGCFVLLNVSLRALLQAQAGELPGPVALSLATYHASHAVMSAANMLGTDEELDGVRDAVLGAAAGAALAAYGESRRKRKGRRWKVTGKGER